jgi:ADP-ribose pyrophosphatase YjhB (NUDIX family)
MVEKTILVSIPVVFKRAKGSKDIFWFLVKEKDSEIWGFPKTIVRRGESSVRAGIRFMAEQGGMRAKVLEEAGRSGGAAKINGRAVTQRYLYYLMVFKDGGEVLGFEDSIWLEHGKALRRLESKRDIQAFKQAKVILKEVQKKRKEARKKRLIDASRRI